MSDKKEEPDYDELQKQWEEDLKSNPKVQKFLEFYRQTNSDAFFKQYAFNKMLAFKYADLYKEQNEGQQDSHWITIAMRHLSIIQQKKLFDAQCKWRGGLELYDGVEICYDFEVWQHDIMNCPFLESPTLEDVDLYSAFLLNSNDVESIFEYSDDWQDYDELKEAYNTNEQNRNIPEWYEFHNSRTGNGVLLTIPDVRGKLEEFYKDLARKEKQKNAAPAQPFVQPTDADKPYLDYYDKSVLLDLAKIIEEKESFYILKNYVEVTEHRDKWENERALENLNYLSQIKDELIPIEAHEDYRKALELACQKYRFKKIVENLPLALEHYQRQKKLKEMGIDSYTEKQDFLFYLDLRKLHADSILLGRKLNKEPQDFNF